MASVTIQGGELTAVIGDNAAAEQGEHRERYNGIWSLASRHQPRSPFVPSYAGFNLEHIFDGSAQAAGREQRFEPRESPMTVERIDAATAQLHQPPTPVTRCESWITFRMGSKDTIDIRLRLLPHEKTWKHDVFGVFFASYIDEPINKSLYLTRPNSGDPSQRLWHQFCTPAHDVLSTMKPEGDNIEMEFDPGVKTLYTEFSPVSFDLPLMFGVVRGMAVAFMIDQTDGVRFSHPWQLGDGGERRRGGRTGDPSDRGAGSGGGGAAHNGAGG